MQAVEKEDQANLAKKHPSPTHKLVDRLSARFLCKGPKHPKARSFETPHPNKSQVKPCASFLRAHRRPNGVGVRETGSPQPSEGDGSAAAQRKLLALVPGMQWFRTFRVLGFWV